MKCDYTITLLGRLHTLLEYRKQNPKSSNDDEARKKERNEMMMKLAAS